MRSARVVSAGQAGTYYEKDNYYTQQLGEYRGKLKEELGLEDLTHASFQRCVYGYHPQTGEKLIQSRQGDNKRAAVDLTFSAPKSLSVALELALAKGDTKLATILQDVHNRAVNDALDKVEQDYAQARITINGKRQKITTGNLLFAKFQHDTSREIDPQLHTHCLAFNFTKDKQGKYRSLEAKALLCTNKASGLFYRNQLAFYLKEAKIDFEITNDKLGFLELKGVPKELLKEFSKRAKQVEEEIERQKLKFPNLKSSKVAQIAKTTSRKGKPKKLDREEVRKINLEQIEKTLGKDGSKKLLKDLQPKQSFFSKPQKIDYEKEVKQARIKVARNLWQSAEKTVSRAIVLNFGKADATKLDSTYKRQEKIEKAQMQSMHALVVEQLKLSKLDTQKLFECDKDEIKERIENVREHNRNREYTRGNDRERTLNHTHAVDYGNIKAARDDLGSSRS
jgi:conjugative relaxase-like TrwC/TraI family protein